MEKIIEFKEYHIEQCEKLEKKFFALPWTKKQINESISNDFCKFLAYDINKILAGYVGVYFVEEEAQILNIAVDLPFQKQGIAFMLLSEIELICNNKNIEFITLEVRKSNTKALSLYSKLGYNVVGERVNFYQNPTENALLLRKNLQNNHLKHQNI